MKLNRNIKIEDAPKQESTFLIDNLNNRKKIIEVELSNINKEIENIRNTCDHDFYFVFKGMYDDVFRCNKCGLTIEY